MEQLDDHGLRDMCEEGGAIAAFESFEGFTNLVSCDDLMWDRASPWICRDVRDGGTLIIVANVPRTMSVNPRGERRLTSIKLRPRR